VFVVEVPDGEEFDAKFAARVCRSTPSRSTTTTASRVV